MKDNKNQVNYGTSFLQALTLVFIVLKIIGKISWSWLWVLAPLWITYLIAILVFLVISIASLFK